MEKTFKEAYWLNGFIVLLRNIYGAFKILNLKKNSSSRISDRGERAILNGKISWYCLINTKESSVLHSEVLVLLQPPHPATKRRQLQVLRKSKEESSLAFCDQFLPLFGWRSSFRLRHVQVFHILYSFLWIQSPGTLTDILMLSFKRSTEFFLNTDTWMNGLAKRKEKVCYLIIFLPLRKKRCPFCVLFQPTIVWVSRTTTKPRKKTKNKNVSSSNWQIGQIGID